MALRRVSSGMSLAFLPITASFESSRWWSYAAQTSLASVPPNDPMYCFLSTKYGARQYGRNFKDQALVLTETQPGPIALHPRGSAQAQSPFPKQDWGLRRLQSKAKLFPRAICEEGRGTGWGYGWHAADTQSVLLSQGHRQAQPT